MDLTKALALAGALEDEETASENLTTDAHLAALATERGAEVCSADHDFARFPRVTHVGPLAVRE